MRMSAPGTGWPAHADMPSRPKVNSSATMPQPQPPSEAR